jgi:hypothetical protein
MTAAGSSYVGERLNRYGGTIMTTCSLGLTRSHDEEVGA